MPEMAMPDLFSEEEISDMFYYMYGTEDEQE